MCSMQGSGEICGEDKSEVFEFSVPHPPAREEFMFCFCFVLSSNMMYVQRLAIFCSVIF